MEVTHTLLTTDSACVLTAAIVTCDLTVYSLAPSWLFHSQLLIKNKVHYLKSIIYLMLIKEDIKIFYTNIPGTQVLFYFSLPAV